MKSSNNIGKAIGSSVLKILMQLIPVAIGVYIGILAGNWNEASNRKEQQDIFLSNIIKEMRSNKKELKRAYEYHSILSDSMDNYIPNLTKENLKEPFFENGGFMEVPGWKGIGIISLENSVYESGILSNSLNGIDFSIINKITKMYSFMSQYKDITDPMTTKIINSTPETTRQEVLMGIEFFCTDVKSIEKNLVEKLEL